MRTEAPDDVQLALVRNSGEGRGQSSAATLFTKLQQARARADQWAARAATQRERADAARVKVADLTAANPVTRAARDELAAARHDAARAEAAAKQAEAQAELARREADLAQAELDRLKVTTTKKPALVSDQTAQTLTLQQREARELDAVAARNEAQAEATAKVEEARNAVAEARAKAAQAGREYANTTEPNKRLINQWLRVKRAQAKNIGARTAELRAQLVKSSKRQEKMAKLKKSAEIARAEYRAEKAAHRKIKTDRELAQAERESADVELKRAQAERASADANNELAQAEAALWRLRANQAKSDAQEEDLAGAKGVNGEGGHMSAQKRMVQTRQAVRRLAGAVAAAGKARGAQAELRMAALREEMTELRQRRRSADERGRKEIDKELFDKWLELRAARDEKAVAETQELAAEHADKSPRRSMNNPERFGARREAGSGWRPRGSALRSACRAGWGRPDRPTDGGRSVRQVQHEAVRGAGQLAGIQMSWARVVPVRAARLRWA